MAGTKIKTGLDLCLIAPFWYVSVAYQATLVEPSMVCILARRSRANIPVVTTNELDLPPKRTK